MKYINNFIIATTSIFALSYLLINIEYFNLSQILVLLSIVPVLLIIKLARKILHIKISDGAEFIYIIFVIMAQLLGSTFKVYDTIKYYDKIVHFSSGIVSSMFAMVVINNTNLKNRTVVTDIIFIVLFALSVAALWEFFEFTSDRLLNGDAQRVAISGTTDTMTDMIAAFLASILYSIIYGYQYKRLVKN